MQSWNLLFFHAFLCFLTTELSSMIGNIHKNMFLNGIPSLMPHPSSHLLGPQPWLLEAWPGTMVAAQQVPRLRVPHESPGSPPLGHFLLGQMPGGGTGLVGPLLPPRTPTHFVCPGTHPSSSAPPAVPATQSPFPAARSQRGVPPVTLWPWDLAHAPPSLLVSCTSGTAEPSLGDVFPVSGRFVLYTENLTLQVFSRLPCF